MNADSSQSSTKSRSDKEYMQDLINDAKQLKKELKVMEDCYRRNLIRDNDLRRIAQDNIKQIKRVLKRHKEEYLKTKGAR